MEYKENVLFYEDYCELRKSVGWLLFSKEQTQKALANSLYTVIAVKDSQTVGMGRLIGDGMYYMVVDIVDTCPIMYIFTRTYSIRIHCISVNKTQ